MANLFSRRHYKLFASEVKFLLISPDPIQPVDIAHLLSDIFRMDNPRFKEQRFVEACGMTWEEYQQG